MPADPAPIRQLFRGFDPFDWSPAARQAFVNAFRTISLHHYHANPVVAGFWNAAGVHPDELRSEKDLGRAPHLMVNLFKENELLSVPEEDIVLTLCSSGTTGQKSQQRLDAFSLENIEHIAYAIHASLGMTSELVTNSLCFSYDPVVAADVGTAFSDKAMTGLTPRGEIHYAFAWSEAKKDFVFSREETLATLVRFSRSGRPVRMIGFPAFIADILQTLERPLQLGRDSWVLTGGGWKGRAGESMDKKQFRELCARALGIPVSNVRDGFGMVEHGIPYADCEEGHLHIPNFARVLVRSPQDLSLVAPGERGLLHLLCCYNTSYPAHSLLTTDYGRIRGCTCGRSGPILEILGRAGTTKHKGCAFQAARLFGP